jgi:predicted RNA-binding protein with PIN domain
MVGQMPDLPDGVAQTLAKAVGAYVRATDANELPARLRPIKKVAGTPKGLARHRTQLLAELDDSVTKARLLEWLDKGKPSLPKKDVELLHAALTDEDGWLERAASSADGAPKPVPVDTSKFEKRIEREKEAARKAKEEARSAREEKAEAVEAEAAKTRALRSELDEARTRIAELDRELRAARAEADAATKEAERQRRNVKKAEERAEAERDRLKARVRAAEEAVRELKAQASKGREKTAAAPKPKAPRRGPRQVLRAPKGRLEDDPKTLDAWLGRDDVHLVVDGYNVTHHEHGFAHLDLEKQRDRLVEMVKVLATKKKVEATIVFDGSEVPPGTRRRRHGSVTVEYSKPDRSGKGEDRNRADDHIVELVEKLPSGPVVVVTNDRELKDRVSALKATTARSEQLLALLR